MNNALSLTKIVVNSNNAQNGNNPKLKKQLIDIYNKKRSTD